jgi:Protein of unknown function (DUF3135)
MESMTWQKEKEKRKKASLKKHARLSRLFKKDRLAFERERKEMIDEVINSVKDGDQRSRLRAFQASWDKKMRGAGSSHNRFVLAQTFFGEHFHEVWNPAIQKYNVMLNGKPDDRNQ